MYQACPLHQNIMTYSFAPGTKIKYVSNLPDDVTMYVIIFAYIMICHLESSHKASWKALHICNT